MQKDLLEGTGPGGTSPALPTSTYGRTPWATAAQRQDMGGTQLRGQEKKREMGNCPLGAHRLLRSGPHTGVLTHLQKQEGLCKPRGPEEQL